jgi:hypothetical protein
MADDPEANRGREPGAPIPKDEIDPELVSLRPRTQIGMVTALSVVAFCVFLSLKLWPDFRFAGEGGPREVTVAELAGGKLGVDSHVTLAADLERAAAVRVKQSPGVPGLRVVPVVGGGDRVWVVLDGDGWAVPREGGRYTGRLRRLSDLPFAGSFLSYVKKHPAPRHVTAEELRRAIGARSTELTSVTGDSFAVADDDIVEIVSVDPDAVIVAASFGERQPDIETWTAALSGAGLIEPFAAPRTADDDMVWFDVERPGALATASKALEASGLWAARVEPVTRRDRASWRQVAVSDSGVTVGAATLPWSIVDVAAIHAARPVPGDPWLLIAGESPDRYWYVRPLYIVIAIFAVLFAWALVRTTRRELLSPKVPTRA